MPPKKQDQPKKAKKTVEDKVSSYPYHGEILDPDNVADS